ncbi:MAG: MOSC domain-containing protein [Verrucomicrobiota bacterium]
MIAAILTSPESNAPMSSHPDIEALAGAGLSGDRYATGKGFYTGVAEWDAHVTLIQREVFETLAAEHGVEIGPADLRRNLITTDIDLNSLIGRDFQIGEKAVFHGRKAWPPCTHIVQQSGRREIFQYLARQTGIGADVLVSGTIRVGDTIQLLSKTEPT